MKLKDLLNVLYTNIYIYTPDGDEYTDLYHGSCDSVPQDLMELVIRNVGVKCKCIDICVERSVYD